MSATSGPGVSDQARDTQREEQAAAVRAILPHATDDEVASVAALNRKRFAIWRALAVHGTGEKCGLCIQDEIGADLELGTNGSGPVRDLRNLGFDITDGRRGVGCATHPGVVTWRALRHPLPNYERAHISARYTSAQRVQIRRALGNRDAFYGTAVSNPEIDHRVPLSRLNGEEVPVDTADPEAIRGRYQPLSRANNTYKREQCNKCEMTGIRPPFLGIAFWYEGDETYDEAVGCNGCGFAYPEKWKAALEAAAGV